MGGKVFFMRKKSWQMVFQFMTFCVLIYDFLQYSLLSPQILIHLQRRIAVFVNQIWWNVYSMCSITSYSPFISRNGRDIEREPLETQRCTWCYVPRCNSKFKKSNVPLYFVAHYQFGYLDGEMTTHTNLIKYFYKWWITDYRDG